MKKWGLLLFMLIILAGVASCLLKREIRKKEKGELLAIDGLCKSGKYTNALLRLEELSNKFFITRKDEIAHKKGLCLMKTGRPEEARKIWESRLRDKRHSKEYTNHFRYEIARLLEIEGQYKEAGEKYSALLSGTQDTGISSRTLLGIANCRRRCKDLKESASFYKRIMTNYPGTPLAEKAGKGLGEINISLIFSPAPMEDSILYEVKRGDSLDRIARKFGTTAAFLMEANHLRSKDIHPGKRLKIIKGKFKIEVDVPKNILTLKLNGKFVKAYPVGTGKFESTPLGEFKIVSKMVNPVWYSPDGIYPPGDPKNILGTRWMSLDIAGYGIHGTTQPETIGKNLSAGCIRMHNKDVEELYKLVSVGTSVIIGPSR